MQFFNPLMLLGLVAAAIPILLHLLNLRKLRTIEFSTLRFLQQIERTQVRRLKLQQWLLLVLRTLLVVLAVLAFARPVVRTSLPVLGGQVRSSVVIVLDNSPSMDTQDERGNRFQWAIRQAEQILSSLKSGDEVALITSSGVLQSKSLGFTTALGAVREELQSLPLAYGSVSLRDMLDAARSVLATAQNAHRELYVISDFQTSMLAPREDSLKQIMPVERVIIVPASSGSNLGQFDLGIDSVGIITRLIEPGKPIEFAVRIRNNGSSDARGSVVRLRFGSEQVAQRAFDLPAGQVRTLALVAPAPPGGAVVAQVELEPDACESNNVRYAACIVPRMPRILVVGTPKSAMYVEAVLSALGERQSPIVERVAPERLGGIQLDGYDVAVFTTTPGPSAVEQLRASLTAGRANALIFADAGTPSEEQQRMARALGIGSLEQLPRKESGVWELRSLDEQHPLFAGVFRREEGPAARAQVESPGIQQALPSTGGVALISMEGGAFLSEHTLGSGRILYCALPPTLEWSAFPTTGLFPVLVGRAVLYLAAQGTIGVDVTVGERCQLEIPSRFAGESAFRLHDPSGATSAVEPLRIAGRSVVDLGRPLVPGVFTIESVAQREAVAAAAVNIPAEEALLHFADANRVAAYISTVVGKEDIEIAEPDTPLGELVARQRQHAELWPWLLGGALLAAAAEMILAARIARRSS
ncbi:MAG: hypothetical protein AA908_05705 [Chlorobi bacterium NICIL-2]|nr:MAG: hypothetical protein AA908_05705 [Chlorobi bacterium NICIL-2]